jgi:hypothetical protein
MMSEDQQIPSDLGLERPPLVDVAQALRDVARSLESEPDLKHVVEGIVAAVTETVPGAETGRGIASGGQNSADRRALDLYSSQLNAFDADAEVVGELFAAHAAIALIGSTQQAEWRTALPRHHRDGQRKLDAPRTTHR